MRFQLFLLLLLFNTVLSAQVYVVNSSDDIDDGVCDGTHCSLREAIIASEADGVPSTIKFNIPGTAPHVIIAPRVFPDVINSDLSVLGESQPGGPGALQINFSYLNYNRTYFWKITGSRFRLTGIEFSNYLFTDSTMRVLQFGDDFNNDAANARISNCSFISDQTFNSKPGHWISIFKASDIKITKNNFGTNFAKSSIQLLWNCIAVKNYQAIGKVTIDSNVFVNQGISIDAYSGNLKISNNIFGALDTSKIHNFLDPNHLAIRGIALADGEISDNFFYGYKGDVISISRMYMSFEIFNNRFFENKSSRVIYLDGNTTGGISIRNNYATLFNNSVTNTPFTFIYATDYGTLNVLNNEVSNYGSFLIGELSNLQSSVKHSGNRIECMWSNAVLMNGRPKPTITSVNANQFTGTGIPGDSVVVYYNRRNGCPGAICEAGRELGRTLIDFFGNWILPAVYPTNSSVSSYQFSNNPTAMPRIDSDFSDCYTCSSPVSIFFNRTLCEGQSISYRKEVYSELNPDDTIIILGNGVICDSIIIVKITFKPKYYYFNTTTCYPDSSRTDTLVFQGMICDSFVIISWTVEGVNNFSKIICDTSSVIIEGKKFDKINTEGIVVIANGSASGCDSVIFVRLKYPSIDTSLSYLNKGLIAVDSGSSYQWIDCNDSFSILQNETNRYFEPSKNGNYAVIIQKDGCIDTSSCYQFIGVGTNESFKQNGIFIFPNPVKDYLNIWIEQTSSELKIRIRDCHNRIIALENYSDQSNITLDVKNLVAGIYFLEIYDGKNFHQTKFLKI